MYSDGIIKKAMKYMSGKGTFDSYMKKAVIVAKNIEHIKNIEKRTERPLSGQRCMFGEFPDELSKKEVEKLLMKFKTWKLKEIRLILKQTFRKFGFYPTPTEFCEIYESKKDELEKTRQKQRKSIDHLQGKVDNLKLENVDLKYDNVNLKHEIVSNRHTIKDYEKQNEEMKKQIGEIYHRLKCKICYYEEIEILVFPCKHLYACSGCFEKVQDIGCGVCRGVIESSVKLYL